MSKPDWGHDTSGKDVAAYFADQVKDRVILVTGPSVEGIGLATALALALQGPQLLILAGRTVSKLEAARDAIAEAAPDVKVRLLQMDLSDLRSVRKAAGEVNEYTENIDILINNAAVMDTPYSVTSEGHELQFVSNYLGHWLFTNLILQKVLGSGNKRIVNVASSGHANGQIRWEDPSFQEGYNKKEAYGQSKTGNMLLTLELAKRYASNGLVAFSLDPGGISTPLQQHWALEEKQDIGRKYGAYNMDGTVNSDSKIWKSLDQGASTLVGESGSYLVDCEIANDRAQPYAKSEENAKKLWGWTNQLLGESF